MSTTENLNQQELLHLGIEAARRGDHGASISYLKDGAERFRDDAKIAYMLGAEYAQIGLFDRAEEEMTRALDMDATLWTAAFQLGLLQLSQSRLDAARTTWGRLDKLPAESPLQLFRQGLEHLAENRFDEARAALEQGIAANTFSPELNQDMLKVLASIPTGADVADTDQAGSSGQHVWLSAYQASDSGETH